MNDTKNLIANILYEAKNYNDFDDIEKLVEIDTDLSQIPVQPLYISLQSTSTDQIAQIVPKLSKNQRQALLDLDLWRRDKIDVASFETWIEVYSKVEDTDLTQEFVKSEDFLIFLKARVVLYTFDAEEPEYPDHDYYFLTDCGMLLVEYSEHFKYPNELKYLIRNLYADLGVENAYSMLFKLINDSFSLLEEGAYQLKKDRLRDYGFVDYYEAIEKLHPFATIGQMNKVIQTKTNVTPEIHLRGQNQSLHSSALVSFDANMENIFREMSLVKDEKRLKFLHFTFIRLINSTITQKDALRGGRIELTRIGSMTKAILELGIQYVRTTQEIENSVFDRLDFFDLYKIGFSLIAIEKNKYLKILKNSPFDADDFEYFLGAWWNSFLDNNDFEVPKVKNFGVAAQTKTIDNMESYNFWKSEVGLFKALMPFMDSFFEAFLKLKSEGNLHDEFYLNYDVENIDFEAILISSFINFSLGNWSSKNVNKMGVTIPEIREFFTTFYTKTDGEHLLNSFSSAEVQKTINDFIVSFGFTSIDGMDRYLYGVISEHLSGYDFDSLENEDFKHIGGPILLNYIKN